MSQPVAASPRLTSQTLAEMVAVARAQRAAARRSRAEARSNVVQAERNYHAALTRGEEAIRLRWAARSMTFDRRGAVTAICPRDEHRDELPVPPGLREVALDRLVSRLFEVGLAVSACRGMVDGQVGPRLDAIIDTLDSMIRDIRQAAFDVQDDRTPGPT